MPLIKCSACSVQFYAKPSAILVGNGKFCGLKCYRGSRKNGKLVNCHVCNTEVYKTGKALNGSKSGFYFCGKSCQTKWRNKFFSGEKHANWKYGWEIHRRIMKESNKPKVCTLCSTEDVRVLAVHHVDRNHRNNELSNLAWLCHNCHFLVHHHKGERLKFMAAMV